MRHGLLHRFAQGNAAAAFFCKSAAGLDQRRIGEKALRRARCKLHPHFCAADHEGIPHVISRIPEINQLFSAQCAEMLPDRQKIRQNLRWMKFVGQPVPHGNRRIFCKRFNNLLPISAIFDSVEHRAEHPRGICNTFFFPDLRAGGIKISAMHTEIMRRHFKAAASAR